MAGNFEEEKKKVVTDNSDELSTQKYYDEWCEKVCLVSRLY